MGFSSNVTTSGLAPEPRGSLHALGPQWREVLPGRWARQCIGSEQSASYNQNICDGHTELTIDMVFTTDLSTPELIQRVRNAWLSMHAVRPEVAIQISTGTDLPQLMWFDTLKTEADISSWLDDSFRVVTDQTATEIINMTYNRRLPTQNKRSMFYLVTAGNADTQHPDRHHFVWNVSHVVADAFSIVQFFNSIADATTKLSQMSILQARDLDYTAIQKRLPISPILPYEAQYNPTEAQRQKAIQDAISQASLYAEKMPQSIAMYTQEDSLSRDHGTYCIRLQYSQAQSEALLAQLRRDNVSITFATAAATVLAVRQIYSKGHETGALLGITRNARRWIDTTNLDAGLVPNAADVVFLWIPFSEGLFLLPIREQVLNLARKIRAELGPHLQSAHYISSMSFTSDRAVEGMSAAFKSGEQPGPKQCAPGFSPQGAVDLVREFHSDSARIQVHDIRHTGRQINDSPWVGMFSLWGRITLSMGFDTKYHEPTRMEQLMALVKSNLGSQAPANSDAITAKL